MSWHSQFGEDKWLHEQGFCGRSGTFIEVGAYDGVSGSNTLAFEEMGWGGVCIEPDLEMAEKCRKNRKALTLACAVGMGPTVQRFHVNPADRGTSSLERPSTGCSVFVPVCSLKDLINRLCVPDLLSIDTEGTELEVWDSIGPFRPKLVIMEFWTQPNPPVPESIIARMTTDGYREIHRTTANLVFERV